MHIIYIIAIAIGSLTIAASLFVVLYTGMYSASAGYLLFPYAVLSAVTGAALVLASLFMAIWF